MATVCWSISSKVIVAPPFPWSEAHRCCGLGQMTRADKMMQGAPGDPHDFGNGRFRNRFRQQGLNIHFAAREFRCAQGTVGTADVSAFRTCRGESLFGPLGNEVAFNLRK